MYAHNMSNKNAYENKTATEGVWSMNSLTTKPFSWKQGLFVSWLLNVLATG